MQMVIGMQDLNRLQLLVGTEAIQSLHNTTVAVIGLGGVGGYAIEALARSGIGKLILIDFDRIEKSNINRQLIALTSTIGRKKVEVWKERILEIQPNCQVVIKDAFLTVDNILELLEPVDYIIDACDTVSTKLELIRYAEQYQIKIISCMGTGNKLDPSLLKITELQKTSYDPLAKALRKLVREANIIAKIPVVCSEETPKKAGTIIASNAFVPAVAGLLCASYVIRDRIGVL